MRRASNRACILRYRGSFAAPPPEMVHEGVEVFRSVFTEADIRGLRQTPLVETNRRSLSCDALLDACLRGATSHFVQSSTPRSGGRFEVKLSKRWAAACARECPAMAKLAAVIESAQGRNPHCGNSHVEWHLMRVAPRAEAQNRHVDQNAKKGYYTVIAPLTRDPPTSGTAFPRGKKKDDLVLNTFGDVVVFRGNVPHYGPAHASSDPRIFLYAAVTTGDNWN